MFPGISHFRFDFAIVKKFFWGGGSNLLLMIFLCVGGHGCVRAYDLTQDMFKATATAAMQSMMLLAVLNTLAVRAEGNVGFGVAPWTLHSSVTLERTPLAPQRAHLGCQSPGCNANCTGDSCAGT